MSVGQLKWGSLVYPLELTPPQFFGWRSGVVAGAIRSREVFEVVADPGRDLVHESSRIDKGG
jgi:hypothetical protein